MTRWITSDWHFGDPTIIKFANRNFSNTRDMDITMICEMDQIEFENGDELFVLGDVGNLKSLDDICNLRSANVIRHLILGNHDKDKCNIQWQEVGFDYVYNYPICLDNFYWLSHEPMYLNSSMPYVNIHGHTHETDMVLMVNGKNMYYNVCVDKTNYIPVSFEKIKESYGK